MWSVVRMAMQKNKWLLIALIFLILIQIASMYTVSATSAVSSTEEWTMYRQDPTHNGAVPDSGSTDAAKLLWNYTTGRMVESSPAVAGGCVFVGCRDSQVYCFNASNGEAIWKYAIHVEIWSSPAIYDGAVYIGADNGYVYCLNMTSGVLLWKSPIGGSVRSSPAVVDGRVYIGSGIRTFSASTLQTEPHSGIFQLQPP